MPSAGIASFVALTFSMPQRPRKKRGGKKSNKAKSRRKHNFLSKAQLSVLFEVVFAMVLLRILVRAKALGSIQLCPSHPPSCLKLHTSIFQAGHLNPTHELFIRGPNLQLRKLDSKVHSLSCRVGIVKRNMKRFILTTPTSTPTCPLV